MNRTPLTINKINAHHDMVRALRRLHVAGFPSALIAGGAIRDLYFGNHIKDVDIFLEVDVFGKCTDPDYIWNIMDCKMDEPFWRFDEITESSPTGEQYVGQLVEQVWDVYRDQTAYQLIFLNVPPEEYVNKHFDIGLCKAYCDSSKLRFTRDFSNDAANKTLTIVAEEINQAQFNYILHHHLVRMKRKFPGYTTRVAPHLMDFIDDSNRHMI